MQQRSGLNRVVEARYYFKSGASLKSQMNKGNNNCTGKYFVITIVSVFLTVAFSSCTDDDTIDGCRNRIV